MKYFDGDYLMETDWEYMILYGGRASGKSTWVAGWIWREYMLSRKNHRFMLVVRNWSQAQNLDGYFSFWDKNGKINVDGNKFFYNNREVGFIQALSTEDRLKSSVMPDVDLAVFEEFSLYDPSAYLPSESTHFLSLMSTVFRNREDGKVIMIGNNNNRMCNYNPYFDLFGINWERDGLKQGDEIIYQVGSAMWRKEEGARCLLVFVPMAYEDVTEIPRLQRVLGNEVATSGDYDIDEQIDEDAVVYSSDWYCWEVAFDDGKYMHFALQPDRVLVDYSPYSIKQSLSYAVTFDSTDIRKTRKLFNKIAQLQRYRPFRFTTYEGKYKFILYQKDILQSETGILL